MQESKKLKQLIEGILYLCGDEGITLQQLEDVFEESKENLEVVMNELIVNYSKNENRGIEIISYDNRYKFVTKAQVHPYAKKLFSETKLSLLSPAAMETLAIIAYKQPITRAEIEELRGVGCDMMIRKLQARNLIQECGRSDAPGKPYLYEVTSEFMDNFQLKSLKELPELREQKLDQESELFS